MKTLITGGAGFLGSHIADRMPGAVCPRKASYDLTHAAGVHRLFSDVRPEIVIHAAATVGGIGANRANPGKFFYENAIMGLHVIEACRRFHVRKLVVIGTVCAYPKFTPAPFREDDLWSGYPEETNAPYGVAKKALLTMCQAYREQYGLHAIYLLPVNLYGPRDNFDLDSSHVIPAIIRKCVEAVEAGRSVIELWGDGLATREFLYVEDAAAGIVAAAERYDGAEPVNLGTGHEIPIRHLAEKIADLTGFRGTIRWDAGQPNGQPRRCLDTTRAEAFGFRAPTDLATGLRATIDWYKSVRRAAA